MKSIYVDKLINTYKYEDIPPVTMLFHRTGPGSLRDRVLYLRT